MSNLKMEDMIICIFAICSQFIWDKKDIRSMEELAVVAANTFIFCLTLPSLLFF